MFISDMPNGDHRLSHFSGKGWIVNEKLPLVTVVFKI